MKIHYEHTFCFCETPCPYGFINGYTDDTKRVGSHACGDCKHFVKHNDEESWVECNFEEK